MGCIPMLSASAGSKRCIAGIRVAVSTQAAFRPDLPLVAALPRVQRIRLP
jgi:hypothetical protein